MLEKLPYSFLFANYCQIANDAAYNVSILGKVLI